MSINTSPKISRCFPVWKKQNKSYPNGQTVIARNENILSIHRKRPKRIRKSRLAFFLLFRVFFLQGLTCGGTDGDEILQAGMQMLVAVVYDVILAFKRNIVQG